MLVLPSFREFCCALLLIDPDVFAGVLTDLEILFRSPSLGLVNGVLTRTGIRIVFGLESSTDCECLSLVGLKSVPVLVLPSFREFCCALLLINPDVFAGVLADLKILFRGSSHGLVNGVLTRTGIRIVFGLKSSTNRESLSLVGCKGVFVLILSCFR